MRSESPVLGMSLVVVGFGIEGLGGGARGAGLAVRLQGLWCNSLDTRVYRLGFRDSTLNLVPLAAVGVWRVGYQTLNRYYFTLMIRAEDEPLGSRTVFPDPLAAPRPETL